MSAVYRFFPGTYAVAYDAVRASHHTLPGTLYPGWQFVEVLGTEQRD